MYGLHITTGFSHTSIQNSLTDLARMAWHPGDGILMFLATGFCKEKNRGNTINCQLQTTRLAPKLADSLIMKQRQDGGMYVMDSVNNNKKAKRFLNSARSAVERLLFATYSSRCQGTRRAKEKIASRADLSGILALLLLEGGLTRQRRPAIEKVPCDIQGASACTEYIEVSEGPTRSLNRHLLPSGK